VQLNYKGLKCPQPVLKLTVAARSIPAGTTLEILADCPSFPKDLEKWCQKSGKVLISCIAQQDGLYKATVQM
jgi:tRNA 2-thiouridine synthesizing protein A